MTTKEMITENNIQRLTWYGPSSRRVRYYVWRDGRLGVNYEIEGVSSIDGFYCSKAEFLAMANQTD